MTCAGMAALGDGSTWHADPGVGPVQVSSPPTHFRELDTGYDTTCAIGIDENVYCWGSDLFGRLGLGIGSYVTQPAPLVFPIALKWPGTIKQPVEYYPWKP